jgi:hypothetical protein
LLLGGYVLADSNSTGIFVLPCGNAIAMPDAQPVDKIKNIIGVVSALVGQIPWALTMWSQYPVSLYQPAIYRGKRFFVVVPMMIGVVAVSALLRYRAAIWFVLTAFLIITAFVYWVYETKPPDDPIHAVNWILSYCAFALLMATVGKLAMVLAEYSAR